MTRNQMVVAESGQQLQRQMTDLRSRSATLKSSTFSNVETFMHTDLSRSLHMNKAALDVKSNTTILESGALLGYIYMTIVDGRHNGIVVNGGRRPSVGVGGFILGGGFGFFTRSFGMGCDSLLEIALVTADGNLVTVKTSDRPGSAKGKLLWALCGAGHDSFGVIVELKLGLHKPPNKDGLVVAGRRNWLPDVNQELVFLEKINCFYSENSSDAMTVDSSWLVDHRRMGELHIKFLFYYAGNKAAFGRENRLSVLNHKPVGLVLKGTSAEPPT